MPIIYYPNRVFKGKEPAIDRVMAKRKPLSVSGTQDITSEALDFLHYSNENWMVTSISFNFDLPVARQFLASIVNGMTVVENLNDYLWFRVRGIFPKKIVLNPGFYTGDELAAELQDRLDEAYCEETSSSSSCSLFTVTYDDTTGIFEIEHNDGLEISYLNQNPAKNFMTTDSIAGHLFGLTEDSGWVTTIDSDTPIPGLNGETSLINEAASVVTSYYHGEIHVLTMDQAIRLETNTAGVVVQYIINYETIV